MLELATETGDPGLEGELIDELSQFEKAVAQFRIELLLSGELDSSNAIFAIHPGAGGTESQDWAQMLLRMYVRWAERKGFKVETLDLLAGDEAGIKSATLSVTGPYAYGYLKAAGRGAPSGAHLPFRCKQTASYLVCVGFRVSRTRR